MTRKSDTKAGTGFLISANSLRHPRGVAQVRIAVAIWLVVLAGIFSSRGYYWGLALLAPAALHLWLAMRLRGIAQSQH